jgi:ATP-binding cassette subfamily B protein
MININNYKTFFNEFINFSKKEFFLLLVLLLIEAVIISLLIISIIPLVDFFLDPSLNNANYITSFFLKILNHINITPSLLIFISFFIFVNFLKAIISTIMSYGILKIKYKIVKRFSYDLLEKIFSARWSFFLKNSTGEIVNTYTNEIKKVASGLNDFVIQITNTVKFISYLITPLIINYKITLITVFFVFIFSIPFLLLGKYSNFLGKKSVSTANIFIGAINETLRLSRIIISFAKKKSTLKKNFLSFENHYFFTMRYQILDIIIVNLYYPFTIIAVGIAILLNLDQNSLSEIAAVLWSLLAAVPHFNSFVRVNSILENLIPSFQQFKNLENDAIKSLESFGKKKLLNFKNFIKVKNVNFCYNQNSPILRNCNLQFNKNKITSIVGSSGTGKSTLIDLILGMQIPSNGNIYFDEINIQELDISYLRKIIGFVPQDCLLFNDTLIANIKWANPNITTSYLNQVLDISNCNEFIKKFPAGYNTVVGEMGNKLSGGQKQRISIARALAKKPQILILDEPTSSLDSKSEQLIQNSIERISKNITTIIVAHRLSTVKNSDQIYVLDKGKVIGEGRYDYLLKNNLIFKKLFRNQIKK